MESDNQANGDAFEHVSAGQRQQQNHFRRDALVAEISFNDSNWSESSLGIAEFRKIHEKLNSQSTEFRTEIDAVKNENKLLLEKNNVQLAKLGELQARNDGFQSKFDELQARLELKAKMDNEQMAKIVEEKVLEHGLLAEKLDRAEKRITELDLALTSKMTEGNNNNSQKRFDDLMQENQRKFAEQMADWDKKWEAALKQKAKQLGQQGKADLDEKMIVVERQTEQKIEEQNRTINAQMGLLTSKMAEESGKLKNENQRKFSEQEVKMANMDWKLDHLEKLVKEIDREMVASGEKTVDLENQWSSNRWEISGPNVQQDDADGLIVSKGNAKCKVTVRAQQAMSRQMLASIPGLSLAYYEVLLKNFPPSSIGWLEPLTSIGRYKSVGECPGSYAINEDGKYWNSGDKLCRRYADEFQRGDVVGSGLLLARDGQLKLFFTKNGRLLDERMVIKGQELLPAVSLPKLCTAIEANFGADPEKKPFRFDINAHESELFD